MICLTALQRTRCAVTPRATDHHRFSTHRHGPRLLRLSLSFHSLARAPHCALSGALLVACGLKVRDIIKLIQDDGWILIRTRGSHRHFKHLQKPGLVTIAGHPSVDVPRGTLDSILKQAGLKQ